MEENRKIIKGNIAFTPRFGKLEVRENSFIVIEGKQVKGIYCELPAEYKNISVTDYQDALIIPGLVDLHFHAPQFANRGLGFDLELLPWLEGYTFPEEAKFINAAYAQEVYKKVVTELWKWGTTRVVLFGTIHKEATAKLMELLAQAGLGGYVGKVNMDRNSPDILIETTEQSLTATEDYIKDTVDRYQLVKPILTPRFVPTCTPELMAGIAKLAKKYNLPVQSHLSENAGEIAWVKELHPECQNYASVYHKFGLFGQQPTIMAHCVYNDDTEIELMAKSKVYVAHCPYSNNNLASGIAPVRKYIDNGIIVGLGTDVAGGHEVSMAKVMAMAVQVSKLKWLATDKKEKFFTIPEVFYMATKGGGSFFGKVGSFEDGYEFDALVIDDSCLEVSAYNRYSIEERLSRFLYIGDYKNIVARYIAGAKIEQPQF
ncbi:Guanine deaminase [Sporomusa rhizae]